MSLEGLVIRGIDENEPAELFNDIAYRMTLETAHLIHEEQGSKPVSVYAVYNLRNNDLRAFVHDGKTSRLIPDPAQGSYSDSAPANVSAFSELLRENAQALRRVFEKHDVTLPTRLQTVSNFAGEVHRFSCSYIPSSSNAIPLSDFVSRWQERVTEMNGALFL